MTIDEKNKALCTLWYESWMFNSLVEYLITPVTSEKDDMLHNAYLESFLIHTRNIVDLLENQKYPSDVKCSDFNVNTQVVRLPKGNSKQEINLWLAHITKERVEKEKPTWKFLEIKNEVNGCLKNFLIQLPPIYKKPKFEFLR